METLQAFLLESWTSLNAKLLKVGFLKDGKLLAKESLGFLTLFGLELIEGFVL